MQMPDPHAEREKRIFSHFSQVAPLPIQTESIQKRQPPEPDISCQLTGIGLVAFELVEVIDQDFAQRLNDQINLQARLREYYENLSEEQSNEIDDRFSNASIALTFREDVLLRERVDSIPLLFEYLTERDECWERDQVVPDSLPLGKFVTSVRCSRGEFNGPIFHVASAGSLSDPILDRVRQKLQNQYVTEHPMELLAYYDHQPNIPESHWLPPLRSFLEENLSVSNFRRVWVLGVHEQIIRLVYPPNP